MNMKNKFIISAAIFAALVSAAYAQDSIDTIKIFKDSGGLYSMGIKFNFTLSGYDRDSSLYQLTDNYNNIIPLRRPYKWGQEENGVKFTGLPLSINHVYKLSFKGMTAVINKDNFERLAEGVESYDKYELRKSLGWNFSAAPVLIQSDSSKYSFGDLGIYWLVTAGVSDNLIFNLEGTVSSQKDDPANSIKFNVSYLWQLESVIPSFLKMRPLCIRTQENTIQTLNYHDISGVIFTSLVISPFENLQSIYLTAAYEYADIVQKDTQPFREGRLYLEVQWGFVGLAGKGSGFFIGWQYWNRLSSDSNPVINDIKERKFLTLELSVPVARGQTINVKYQNGNVAPTFINTTNVSLGLHVDLNGLNLL